MNPSTRLVLNAVRRQRAVHPTNVLTHSLQSRQSWARSATRVSARFASTAAGKQPTLKERLAQLIPQELEKVCLPSNVVQGYYSSFSCSGQGRPC
jgi:hypothetical protein